MKDFFLYCMVVKYSLFYAYTTPLLACICETARIFVCNLPNLTANRHVQSAKHSGRHSHLHIQVKLLNLDS